MERAPVFVRVDENAEIQEILEKIQEKLNQAHSLMEKATELKKKEDEHLAAWQHDLEDVSARLLSVDKALAEPEI